MKYSHGGDIHTARRNSPDSRIIDFSANINPLGLPDSVKEAIIESVPDIINYPDPHNTELIEALSVFEGVSASSFICGNGAADLIFRAVFALRPKKALLLSPCFSEYESALRASGCEIAYYGLLRENRFRLTEDFLEVLNEEHDMLFVCSPNNPTSRLADPGLLERILDRCAECGTAAVIDECFLDFAENGEKLSMKNRQGRVLVLKAFTKIFSMPGMRLGYGITHDREMLEAIEQISQPWAVSLPAQRAGAAALKNKDFITESRKYVKQQSIRLQSAFAGLGFEVFRPDANFILFRTQNAQTYLKELSERGILMRDCSNFRGLDNSYLRCAVRSKEDNEVLIDALNEIFHTVIR